MTHYVKTTHSDKTICGEFVFQLLRADTEETTTALRNVTCKECITGIEDVLRRIKNGVTNGKDMGTETAGNS